MCGEEAVGRCVDVGCGRCVEESVYNLPQPPGRWRRLWEMCKGSCGRCVEEMCGGGCGRCVEEAVEDM